MITDNELLNTWPSRSCNMDLNDKKIWFARQVIRMAQEVRPLVVLPVTDDQDGMIGICHTDFGNYEFYQYDSGNIVAIDNVCVRSALQNHDEAIAAAQADFNRRVLENLTHGVADET